MKQAVDTLRRATEEIWTSPPEGLQALATMHRPPSGDLPKRLYANFDAYWLAGMLYHLREMSGDETLEGATLNQIAGRMAEVAARRLATWGLNHAARTVENTAGELKTAENASDLRNILSELVVFIDRIHVWIDSTIPWAAMDELNPGPIPRIDR
jgi:hypothetical protein